MSDPSGIAWEAYHTMEDAQFFSGEPKRLHWNIPDPAKVEGTEIKINTAFEIVFNQLKLRIEKELQS